MSVLRKHKYIPPAWAYNIIDPTYIPHAEHRTRRTQRIVPTPTTLLHTPLLHLKSKEFGSLQDEKFVLATTSVRTFMNWL